jgi:predicted transcriptional regulator of viral defense system
MSHHGFTEQVPQVVMASTPKKVVTPSMRESMESERQDRHFWEIGGVRYEYVTVKPDYFFGIEEIWVDQTFRVPITDPERTLLDLFAQPRLFGGLGEALAVLQEHAADINVHRLVSYAVRYGKGSVAKRLGWSLEHAGISSDALIPLLEMPTTGYRILDPTKPYRGPCDSRWGIQNNLDSRAVQ